MGEQLRTVPAGTLEAIARELGETASGDQLTRLFGQAGLTDRSGQSTKWRRIYHTLASHQQRVGDGRAVVALIHAIMDPGRWVAKPERYEDARAALNVSLALLKLKLTESGRLVSDEGATTLTEAQQRAQGLRSDLIARGVHEDVLAFCRPQLLQANYFHAVLEACKSVAAKVRELSGLTGDTVDLYDRAFTTKHNMPPIAFNKMTDSWERSEHQGLATLIKGVSLTYRNTTAHAPAVTWATDRSDALDLLTLVSMLHRRLDAATVTPAAPASPHYQGPPST